MESEDQATGISPDMPTITVTSSDEIVLVCPKCENRGTIRLKTPPDKDFRITCKKCKEKILVKVNKRSYYRKDITVFVKYTIKSKRREGKITDISMGGVSIEIEASKFIPPFEKEGNVIEMVFALPPKDEKLDIFGEIIRINKTDEGKYSLGIKFVDLPVYASKEIGYFLM
ncbi:MAG: PilZ domain-containing protein [Candidatus Magnetoovum sp. WYHC-5]|nr:PilZ domain-containing protein [Candidatus Magnetoovum sp. WYHC-5]